MNQTFILVFSPALHLQCIKSYHSLLWANLPKACRWERPEVNEFAIPRKMSCGQIPLTMYPSKRQLFA